MVVDIWMLVRNSGTMALSVQPVSASPMRCESGAQPGTKCATAEGSSQDGCGFGWFFVGKCMAVCGLFVETL